MCVSVSSIVDERMQLEMDIFIIYVYIISGEVGEILKIMIFLIVFYL